jgi:hypothetical protein
MDKVTIDDILNWIKDKVESRKVDFDPKFWMEVAQKINILLPDEIAKFYEQGVV